MRGKKHAPPLVEASRSGPHGAMWQSEASHAGWPPPQPKARCAAGLVKSSFCVERREAKGQRES